jgi:DNA-binding transcriptional regulator YiaG
MTPDRLRECLDAIGWSQRAFADYVAVNERQVRRWATGQYRIPNPIAAWIDTLARFHEAHPAPMAPSEGSADYSASQSLQRGPIRL